MNLNVSQSLSPALVDIRKMCYHISDTGLCHMDEKHTYTLQEYRDVQFKQLQEVLSYICEEMGSYGLNEYEHLHCACLDVSFVKALTDLEKFKDLVKQVTVCACRSYLSAQYKLDGPGVSRLGHS